MAVTEIALLPVKAADAPAFEAAMAEAARHMRRSDGFLGIDVRRPVTAGEPYLLSVQWSSVEAHRDGFRGSPEYREWSRLLHGFYDELPAVSYVGESIL